MGENSSFRVSAVVTEGRAIDLVDTDSGRLWPIEVVAGGETSCFVDDKDDNHTLLLKFRAMWTDWLPRLAASPAGRRRASIYRQWTVFENFARWSERHGYVAGALLARIDASRGWGPDNCLWVDRFGVKLSGGREQDVFAFGRKMTVLELSRTHRCVVGYETLRKRIASGMEPEKAATIKAIRKIRESMPLFPAGQGSGNQGQSNEGGEGGEGGDDSVQVDSELRNCWNGMLSRLKNATEFRIPHAGRVKAHGTRIGRARRTGRHKKLPKHKSFEPSWSKYPVFARWAVESGYRPGMRLARRDARDGWFPENCFWTYDEIRHATIEDGVLAKRKDAVLIEAFGESKTAPDWARDSRCCGVSATCIRERVKSGTWAPEDAITTPAFPRSSGMKREQFRKSVNQGEAKQ